MSLLDKITAQHFHEHLAQEWSRLELRKMEHGYICNKVACVCQSLSPFFKHLLVFKSLLYIFHLVNNLRTNDTKSGPAGVASTFIFFKYFRQRLVYYFILVNTVLNSIVDYAEWETYQATVESTLAELSFFYQYVRVHEVKSKCCLLLHRSRILALLVG